MRRRRPAAGPEHGRLADVESVLAGDHRAYPSFDALRGAMMLLGIYLHAAVAYSERGNWPWKDGAATGIFDISLGLIHVFRMPVFYVMAGFFAALLLERRGPERFIRNRAVRILVPFAVGWLVLFPLVAALAALGTGLQEGRTAGETAQALSATGLLRRRLDPMHLWFLEYLLMFYAVALAALPFARHLRGLGRALDRSFRTVVTSSAAPVLLAIPTCPILFFMETGAIDDAAGFAPEARLFVAYGLCFGWGWLLWRNVEVLPGLAGVRRGGTYVSLGAVTALLGYLLWYWQDTRAGEPVILSVTSAWCLAGATWLFVLGFIGLAVGLIDREIPWVRYVADSSYWLYLAHVPVLLGFQLALAETGWPPAIKMLAVLTASLATLLGSYHVFVRPTWIGAVLNGRRHRIPAARRPARSATIDA
jgi:peptidoglycan/LPS O-acetylase OafA/YrhL